jgi:hypothetical protein
VSPFFEPSDPSCLFVRLPVGGVIATASSVISSSLSPLRFISTSFAFPRDFAFAVLGDLTFEADLEGGCGFGWAPLEVETDSFNGSCPLSVSGEANQVTSSSAKYNSCYFRNWRYLSALIPERGVVCSMPQL